MATRPEPGIPTLQLNHAQRHRMSNQPSSGELPLTGHLMELRQRLMRSLIVVIGFIVVLMPFSRELYAFLAMPLLAALPADTGLIATGVAAPFLAPFKLVAVLGVFGAAPYLLYQLWSFIAPGLYRHEQRLAVPLLISSVVLFYCGAAFAYYVVFPLVFVFFTQAAPEGVAVMTDISAYLDFVLKLFFAFGIAFEVPIATLLLVLSGIALIMTVGVYGLVAGIVKLDDAGLHLMQVKGQGAWAGLQRWVGARLLSFAPWLMKALAVVGTVAMFMVGGGILIHGVHALDAWIKLGAEQLGSMTVAGPLLAAVMPTLASIVIGMIAGAAVLALVSLWQRLRGS